MKTLIFAAAILSTVVACKKNPDNGNQTEEDNIEKLAPVETRTANTNYTSAFSGQTRTFGIKTKAELDVQILNHSLQSPWGLAALPNGNWIITQKSGTMVVLNADGLLKATINNLPAVNAGGQGGLLDVQIDPQFESNRMVYWTYSENVTEGTLTAVSKGRLAESEQTIENIETIYRALPAYNGTNHYGGRIAFDNANNIFVSTGDRSDANIRNSAQDKSMALGKVLRIRKDGTAVPDNPYANDATAIPELYSYGSRNVQSLAFDPINNILWEAELGPRGGDEINKIEAGKNYGWPIITYGLEYSGAAIGSGITQQNGMEQPLYYWDPVVSPSGMIFYNNDYHSEWKGNLLIACLSGQHIVRIRLFNGKIAGEERLLADEGQRFRSVATGIDGKVYAITDAGRFYQIGKK